MKEKEIVLAALDWSQCPAVESVPGKLSGAMPGTYTQVNIPLPPTKPFTRS